jgi:hypothetical protein
MNGVSAIEIVKFKLNLAWFLNDNNSKCVFSHTRVKKFQNKILTKFNKQEWKQNQYYVTNFLYYRRHVLISIGYGIAIIWLLMTKAFSLSFKWFQYFPYSLQKWENSCQEQDVIDRFENRDWLKTATSVEWKPKKVNHSTWFRPSKGDGETVADLLSFHQITVVFHGWRPANKTDNTATTMGLVINFVILDTCCYIKESTNCFTTQGFRFQLWTNGCFRV